jgi:restriction system protein
MKKDDPSGAAQYFGPLLNALRELGGSGTPDEVVDQIAEDLHVSEEVQEVLLSSGEPRFRNQVRWARMFLVREGYIDSSKRGVWKLTASGFSTHLSGQDSQELLQKWTRIFAEERRKNKQTSSIELTADEVQEVASEDYRMLLVQTLVSLPPAGFERFAQYLLRASGFSQVQVTGRTGDGGIDGIGIFQINPLMSLKIVFQCKRYQGSVSAGAMRDFRGALAGRSDKGLFLTTGTFTSGARQEATRDGVPSIELVDSDKLIGMLLNFQIGVKK